MKEKFWCTSCKKILEAKGNKKEWTDPIYGPCMKFTALCPKCNTECDEYRDLNAQKKQAPSQGIVCRENCHSCDFSN
ncbi:MAG: hypothetical protein V1904_13400 [Bacteroidota bacterium]